MANQWFIDFLDHDLATVIATFQPEQLHFVNRISDICDSDWQISRTAVDSTTGNPLWPTLKSFSSITGAGIGPYRSGYSIRKDTNVLQQGLITSMGGAWGQDYMSMAGKDYLHSLQRRIWPFDPANPTTYIAGPGPFTSGTSYDQLGVDLADIVQAMLDMVLSLGDSVPLTYTLPPTGIVIDYQANLADTTYIFDAIQTLGQQEPGFDFEVTPDLQFHMYAPKKYGTPAGIVSAGESGCVYVVDDSSPTTYPNGLQSLTFTNTGPGGTHILGTGAGLSTELGVALNYIAAQDIYWRLDNPIDYGDITSPSMLLALAQADLSLGVNPIHEISIVVDANQIAGFWTSVFAGLALYLKLDLGWHMMDSPHQILEMDATINTEGDEIVTLNLNQIYDTSGLTGVAGA